MNNRNLVPSRASTARIIVTSSTKLVTLTAGSLVSVWNRDPIAGVESNEDGEVKARKRGDNRRRGEEKRERPRHKIKRKATIKVGTGIELGIVLNGRKRRNAEQLGFWSIGGLKMIGLGEGSLAVHD